MPIFLNTVIEGRPGGGYDVRINGSLYFQFKIPMGYYDELNHWVIHHWQVFNHPYYKIKLETDSRQFHLLQSLKNPTNEVCYVAPEFHERDTLRTHYLANDIVNHSAMFPIESFQLAGAGSHHLIYHPNHDFGRLFSEPIEIKKKKLFNPLELFPRAKEEMTIYQQAKNTAGLLMEFADKKINIKPFTFDVPEVLVKEVYTTLLVNYNIHWYPVISI